MTRKTDLVRKGRIGVPKKVVDEVRTKFTVQK